MNRQQLTIERLKKLLAQDTDALRNLMILKDHDKFYVFDRYTVEPNKNGARVSKHSSDPIEFSSLRVATSWCIADKYGQLKTSMEIQRLDQQKTLLAADVSVRTELIKRMRDREKQEIMFNKLSSKKTQLTVVSEQLDKCVNLAKYWQIRGFNNETVRTGRTASNRTRC
jgi:hypothetical protein